jgi:toxin-antitoxin system PIN domain toxin
MHLPDINVWLALTFLAHVHHNSARSWFDGLPGDRRCYFCRFTQQGFLRLANNPKVFAQVAVAQDVAWKLYDAIVSDPRIEFASEPPLLEPIWRKFTGLPRLSPNTWSDAYLAAFALAGGYEVVTFDKGFNQFSALSCTILS